MSILRLWYTLFVRLLVRLFVRRIIVVLPADERREHFPYGLKLVAVDPWKTEWTIVEGFHDARVDHNGVWYMPDQELGPSVIFSLTEARSLAVQLAAVGEMGEVGAAREPAVLSATGSTAAN